MALNNESITFTYKNDVDGGEFTFTKTIKDGDCVETIDVAEAFANFLTVTGYGIYGAHEHVDGSISLEEYPESFMEGAASLDLNDGGPTLDQLDLFKDVPFEPSITDTYVSDEKPEVETYTPIGLDVGDAVLVTSKEHTDSAEVFGLAGIITDIHRNAPFGQSVLVKFGGETTWWLHPSVLTLIKKGG